MPSSSNSCTPVTRPSGSWMMDRKRGVATLVAASVMVVGGASGAAAATPRTAPAPVAVVATSASTVTVAPAAVALRATAPSAALAVAVAPDSTATTRSWVSWVAGIVLKYSGVAWSTLKSIVSKGYTYFKGWWDNLSSWVRWTINQILGLSIGEIYNALKDYFF